MTSLEKVPKEGAWKCSEGKLVRGCLKNIFYADKRQVYGEIIKGCKYVFLSTQEKNVDNCIIYNPALGGKISSFKDRPLISSNVQSTYYSWGILFCTRNTFYTLLSRLVSSVSPNGNEIDPILWLKMYTKMLNRCTKMTIQTANQTQ